MRAIAAVIVLLTATLAAAPAGAQDVRSRRMGVRWRDGVPHLSFNVRDMANATVRHELDSGLPRTMVTTIYAYRENGGRPIAASALSCRVTKDLLEDNYRVQVESASTDRTARLATLDDVIERCLVVRNRGVGSADDFRRFAGQRIFFAVLVLFQPVSREEVQRIRRLLARGGGLDDDRFFGPFVSMFVNRDIGEAQRTVRFRSQAVPVPR